MLDLELDLDLDAAEGGGSANAAPTDIAWAGSHSVAEDAALGAQVGGLLTAADPEAGAVTFSLPDDAGRFDIGPGGNTIVVAGVLDFDAAASHSITVRATDDEGGTYDEVFAVTVTSVSEDAPEDPPPDDDVIVDDEDHFDVVPYSVVVDGSVKFAGKKKANGLSAKFMHDFSGDVGPLEAGKEYIFEFTADFSQMANDGHLAAVGIMLKSGNDFYSLGVRGDGGAIGLDVYQVDGPNKWNQTTGFTLSDEGAVQNGAQWGPIWLKVIVSEDGTALTLQTGTDVDTWDDELVEVPFGSFGDVGDVTNWGIGGIFDAADSGAYSINITYWEIVEVLGARYWSVEITGLTSGQIANLIELQLYDGESGFGSNIIAGGTESADSSFSGAHTPDNAIDGVIGSGGNVGWSSADTALPHRWTYDFGSGQNKAVTGFALISTVNAAFNLASSPDGSTWTPHISVTGESGWGSTGYEWRRFLASGLPSYSGSPHGAHQHWRIRCPEDNGGGFVSAAEIEFRATPGGADQATGGTALEDGHTSSGVSAQAFDNNNSTIFLSTGTSAAVYIGYSFTAPVEVAEIAWRMRSDAAENQAPKTLIVEYADSSSGPWTFAWQPASQTGWSLGEVRTFTDPNYVL